MDQIKIVGLEVYAGHGVFSEETRNGQIFVIDVIMYTDLRPAGEKDELTLSTHYGEVCQFINQYMKQHTFQLIEAAGEQLAEAILLSFPLIHSIELEIKKPNAPIGLPVAYASVKINRGWKQVYLGVGSNMGERRQLIQAAFEAICNHEKIREAKLSDLMITKPYGGVEQEDFLNGAIGLKTLLSPHRLLDYLHELETKAGRERKLHWGPRTLDLDILYYEDCISEEPELTIPHPDMGNRSFVLEPLKEISPYYKDPLTGKTIDQMREELSRRTV